MAPGGDPVGEQELSLTTIWRTVFKHKVLLLSTAALIFAAVMIRTITKTPVYESVARLQIDPSRSSNLGLDDIIKEKLGSGDFEQSAADRGPGHSK